jgi:hypothetical protein
MKTVHLFAYVGLLYSNSFLSAQSAGSRGEISGIVVDAQRATISGAEVTLTVPRTGFRANTVSTADGSFRFSALEADDYNLSITAVGYSGAEIRNLRLPAGTTVSAPIRLSAGGTTQMVDAGDFILAAETPAPPSNSVGRNLMPQLPTLGRRFHEFALLTPTVQTEPERSQLSFSGQRGVNANILLDGADYTNPFYGGIRGGERSNYIMTVPQSAIQEFQTLPSGFPAEYGRSTGGVLNAITRNGGNAFHGDVLAQLRHKEAGLQTPFQRQILENLSQWGGSAGGPIRRNRQFWYSAYEQQRSRTPRQILFGALVLNTPTPNTVEAYRFLQSLEGPFESTNDGWAMLHRYDKVSASGQRWTARYNVSDASARNAASALGSTEVLTNSALSANGDEKNRTHSGLAQWTAMRRASLTNDLRVSASYELRPRTTNSQSAGVSSVIGQFGARNNLPTSQNDTRMQVADGLSLARGKHAYRFGIDYSFVRAHQDFGLNQFGSFLFNTANLNDILDILSAGGAVANRFDSPLVTYLVQVGNRQSDLSSQQAALFVQDTWRIHPRLVIDLGFRWEGSFLPAPETNNAPLASLANRETFPNGLNIDPYFIPSMPKQWMPRAGFAVRPFAGDRMIVRASAGFFHGSTPLILITDPMNNFRLPAGNVSISLPLPGSTVYRDFLAAGIDLNNASLGSLPRLSQEQVLAINGGRDLFTNARLTAMAPDYRNPRSFQAGLGVDQRITARWKLSFQMSLLNTVHLQRNRDYNLPAPRLLPNDRSLRPNFGVAAVGANRVPRPIPELDRLTVRESNARSLHRGATVSSSYRNRRLQWDAHYTISETFSDDDSERTSTGFNYSNAFALAQEYGFSRLDARHQFTSHLIYSVGWGIDISAIARARTGLPIDPLAGMDYNQDASNSDRALRAPGALFPRNSFRNQPFKTLDLRFMKSFPLREQMRLQFSCDMFNVFNFPNVMVAGRNLNYGPGVDTLGNTVAPLITFRRLKLPDGTYDPVNTQLGTPFQAQFGLRLFF